MAAREHSFSDWVDVVEGGNPWDAGGAAWVGAGGAGGAAAAAGVPTHPHVEEDMFGVWAAEQGEGSRSCKVESGPVDRMVPAAVAKVSDLADQQSPVVRMPRHSVESFGAAAASRGSSSGNCRDSAVPPTLPSPSLERSASSGTTQRAVAPSAAPAHHHYHSASQGGQWGRATGTGTGSAPIGAPLGRSQSLPVAPPSTAAAPPPTNGALPVPAVPVPAAAVAVAPFLPAGPYAASIWSFTVHAPSAVVREALLATMRCDSVVIVENAWQFVCTTPKDQEPMGPVGRLSAASPQLGTFSVWMHTVFQPAVSSAATTPGAASFGQPQYPCLVEFSSASRCSPMYFRAVFDHVVAAMTRLAGTRGVSCQVGV